MNPQEMIRLVDAISRDRNVDKDVLYGDIEQAMVSAARKHFNALDAEDFSSTVDRLTGQIRVFRGEQEIELASLGRIPAQTAKQVMIQRFREDERTSIYNEYIERVGELVTGQAQRYEGGALIVQVGRAEGFMPRSEQIPGEQHQPGDRVRCLILDVRESGSQVKIVLSRAHPDFIRRMFEVEVPEVAERIIEIKALAREPGRRTKIAVSSIDSKVDAVGACVGVRGSRIKNIVDECGGEKIDIVRWNESSQILIQYALKPAEVVEISLCFELGRATVVVNEDQLSLAIGKHGQNVRLAARLTNWDIDILTPAEFTKSLDTMEAALGQIEGMDEEKLDRLAALGVISVFDVEDVGTDDQGEFRADFLTQSLEVDADTARKLVEVASIRAKEVAEEQQREKEEAARRRAEEEATRAGDGSTQSLLDDVLGGGEAGERPGADGGGDDIVSLLESRQDAGQAPIDDSPLEAAAADAAAEAEAPEAATTEVGDAAVGEVEADVLSDLPAGESEASGEGEGVGEVAGESDVADELVSEEMDAEVPEDSADAASEPPAGGSDSESMEPRSNP